MTEFERFLFRIEVTKSGCWERHHLMNRNGYSRVSINGKRVMAHIYSYELFKRKVPDGHVIRHVCDNRCCCNPDHLVSGTEKANARDRTERGRHNKQKLTSGEVTRIREQAQLGERITNLSEEYNVSVSTIRDIVSFRTWVYNNKNAITAEGNTK